MKKILSLLLTVTLLFTLSPTVLANDYPSVTAYVSISKYGEFVSDENGMTMVAVPVTLQGKQAYDLNDVFTSLHNQYCPDGYSSAEGDYGAYITKLWNDESENFSYQVNSGSETVMGLTHQIEDGDYVDASINQNWYPDTEAYTRFDTYKKEILIGESTELILSQVGYDENWNTVFSPCTDATITINGDYTQYTTDSDGKAILSFDEAGTFIISASKTKTVGENTVTAITAPICIVCVKDNRYITTADAVVENITARYTQSGVSSDQNMAWFIADLAMYDTLYPHSEYGLSGDEKQECIDQIIENANDTSLPSALAKNILALRALGYDATDTYTDRGKKLDIVEELTELVDAQSDAVTNVYTLPYVIIALRQSEDYATDEQMDFLINSAISSKDSWQINEWGTDAASAMLVALAPYYDTDDEVKNIVDETIHVLKAAQDENGMIGNAASTGLAIAAFSALGINAEDISNNGINLIQGLLTEAYEDLNGFYPDTNSFSTEQGYRGLLAWKLLLSDSDICVYNFSSKPMKTAESTRKRSSGSSSSSSSSSTSTSTATSSSITETEDENDDKTVIDTTEVTESKPRTNVNPDIKVLSVTEKDKTFADISQHKNKAQIEALAERKIINGKSLHSFDPDASMTRAEFAAIISRGLGLPEKDTAVFSDISEGDWFFNHINTAYQYGIIKGVSETEFNPNGAITRQEAAVMVARAAKLCGMNTEISDDSARDTLAVFADYIKIEGWAKTAMAFCYDIGILNNDAAGIIPDGRISRAEVADMIYNMLKKAQLLTEEAE